MASCKYGKVKSGARKGRCRKARVKRRGSSARSGVSCKYGKLKSPRGRRVCRKRRR